MPAQTVRSRALVAIAMVVTSLARTRPRTPTTPTLTEVGPGPLGRLDDLCTRHLDPQVEAVAEVLQGRRGYGTGARSTWR